MPSFQLHKRNKGRTTQNHNLSETTIVQFKDLLFQILLIVTRVCILVIHLTIDVYLKHRWFNTTNNFYFLGSDRELYLNNTRTSIYSVKKLWLIDTTKWFTEQTKTKCIKNSRLACTVLTNNQCGRIFV